LLREPGLADAPWPGEGHQAHVIAQEQGADGGHLSLAADKRTALHGQVVRPAVEGDQGREVRAQPCDYELEDALWA
jgi:hypothetical protein